MKKNFYIALTLFIIVILACSRGKKDDEDNEDTESPKDKTEEVKDEEEKVKEKIVYNIPVILEEYDIALIPLIIVNTEEEDFFGRIKEYIDEGKRTISYSKRYNMFDIDNLYNVIFYNKATGEEYPLLDKKELINNFYIPVKPSPDTLQAKISNFILYSTIEGDYNDDDDIDEDDGETVYLCDIYGKNKKQITNKNISLLKWEIDTKYDILFLLIKEDSDSDKKFTYKDNIKILKTSLSNPGLSVEVIRDSLHNEIKKIYE